MSPDDALRAASESKIYREQALPDFVTIRRRRLTPRQAERIARAARKMGRDFRKFIKRKTTRGEL